MTLSSEEILDLLANPVCLPMPKNLSAVMMDTVRHLHIRERGRWRGRLCSSQLCLRVKLRVRLMRLIVSPGEQPRSQPASSLQPA